MEAQASSPQGSTGSGSGKPASPGGGQKLQVETDGSEQDDSHQPPPTPNSVNSSILYRARSSLYRSNSLQGLARLKTARDDNPWVPIAELSGLRLRLAKVVRTELFDVIMISILLLNLAVVIYDADARARGNGAQFYTVLGWVFLGFYTIEISARIYIDRCTYFYGLLNKLDFLIVVLDICAQLAISLVSHQPSVAWLRLFRVVRLLRVIRRIEGFRELWLMLHGLASAVKAMSWACVLIFCVLMVWSLVAVEVLQTPLQGLLDDGQISDCDACIDAFKTINNSAFTWFLLIFAGELWNDLVVPFLRLKPWTMVIFFSAYVTINLGLMNLILTVIVDRANAARVDDEHLKVEEKKGSFEKARMKLLRLCQLMDLDNSGCLTLGELEQGFEDNVEFQATLKVMDVAKEDLRTVFSILDEDRSGSVTYEEFVGQLHKMKTQEAQTLLVFIKHYVVDVRQKVSEQLDILKAELVEKVDEHTAITNRLARRMGRATGMDMAPTPVGSDGWGGATPLSPSSHCVGSPRLAERNSFQGTYALTERNASRKSGGAAEAAGHLAEAPTASWNGGCGSGGHLLERPGLAPAPGEQGSGGGGGPAWSRPNFGPIDSRPVTLTEISLRTGGMGCGTESLVATELRRLSDRLDHALAMFVRDATESQTKNAEFLTSLEGSIEKLLQDELNVAPARTGENGASVISGRLGAVIVPIAMDRGAPCTPTKKEEAGALLRVIQPAVSGGKTTAAPQRKPPRLVL